MEVNTVKKYIILIILTALTVSIGTTSFANISLEAYKIIEAKPNTIKRNTITITNHRNVPITVQVWVEDWKTVSEDGHLQKIALGSAGDMKRSLAPFLEIKSPTKFTIKSHRSKELVFTTTTPDSGSYWTAIAFAIQPEESSQNIQTQLAFYSKIIRYNKNSDQLKPTITYLSQPVTNNNTLQFTTTVTNQGEVAFFFTTYD